MKRLVALVCMAAAVLFTGPVLAGEPKDGYCDVLALDALKTSGGIQFGNLDEDEILNQKMAAIDSCLLAGDRCIFKSREEAERVVRALHKFEMDQPTMEPKALGDTVRALCRADHDPSKWQLKTVPGVKGPQIGT